MKRKPSCFEIACLFFLFLAAYAEALPEESSSNTIDEKKETASQLFITAENYCDFLNQASAALQKLKLEVEAASNPNDFYDEKMLEDYIMRTGPPGNYRYDVIRSTSTNNFNSCIAGLSWNDALQYCEWHKCSASTSTGNFTSCVSLANTGCDASLRSNTLIFYLKNNSATESGFDDRDDKILSPRNCIAGLLILIGVRATATYCNEHSNAEQNQFDDFSNWASMESDDDTKAPPTLKNGGIRNSGVDCYLSSALQTLKTIYQNSSLEQQAATLEKLEEKKSLHGFFQGTLDATSSKNARALRRDVASLISNAEGLLGEDRHNLNENGDSINQADPIDALRALLPQLDMPSSVRFGRKRSRLENGNSVEVDTTELGNNTRDSYPYIDCTLSLENSAVPITMQDLLHEALHEERHAYFSDARKIADEDAIMNEQIGASATGVPHHARERRYDTIFLEKKIIDPVPYSLVISIKRLYAQNEDGRPPFLKIQKSLSTIAAPIEVPAYLNSQECTVTYEPVAIICHHGGTNGGHYICYRKEVDGWHELDDHWNTVIDQSNEKEVHEVSSDMQKNSCVVTYVRKQNIFTDLPTNTKQEEASSKIEEKK